MYLDTNNLYSYLHSYVMSKFLPTSGFKWIDPNKFDLSKYTSHSSKGCVLEVDFEYPKEFGELHNDPLARKMVPEYQLKIADFYNIPIGNIKKLVPKFFHKEKYLLYHENQQLYLRLGLKLKKNTSRIRVQSITVVKTIY